MYHELRCAFVGMYFDVSSSAFACNLLLVQQPESFLLRKDNCTVHFLQLLVAATNLSRNQRHVVATQLYAMLHDVLNDWCLRLACGAG